MRPTTLAAFAAACVLLGAMLGIYVATQNALEHGLSCPAPARQPHARGGPERH